ncbi:MAG: hypothetical protein VX758_01025 [Bacteroidota bacterium]|nr:hypothetical protein [Bacteroidota bacterium]
MNVLACLGAVAVLAWTAGVVLGRARAKPRQANVSPSQLKTLQGRMLHAQNMGMRLQELASNQQRLQEEQAHLQLLQDLKDEVHWLLSEVESTLTKHHEHDPDWLEDMLDATGKALRLVLDAGRQPMTTWQRAQETLTHLHKTLCLIRDLPTPTLTFDETQNAEKQCHQVVLIKLMIEFHRLKVTDEMFPFLERDSGVTARLSDGTWRSVSWSQDVRKD